MTDSLPIIWPADPHTLAKHRILRKYLDAWFPILSRHSANIGSTGSREILFIDGFAGPGEYSNGESGSPVIALRAAIEHEAEFPMPVRLLFIEKDHDRFTHLQSILEPLMTNADACRNVAEVVPKDGDCDTVLSSVLMQYERKNVRFGPALAFLDQFGYGAVSMDLISRILSYPQCEVFTYLSYKEMNRWITDPHKSDAFNRAFGGEEWRDCKSLPEKERRRRLLEIYVDALRKKASAKYVVWFLMYDQNNQPLYWLLFCSNHLRGLEEMKKAMWRVDESGDFRFSDKDDPTQLDLLDRRFDQRWLAEELRERLKGKSISAYNLKEYVLVATPCYLFKSALQILEQDGVIEVERPPSCNRGFPDASLNDISLRFIPSLF